MSLECKIYQRELRVLGYGLPLYEPNPAEYDQVRVGDVGIVQKNGYFRRIFNALPQLDPNGDDINATYGVPETFEPLPEACRSTTTSNEISAGSWLRSDHVKQIEGDFDFSMSAVSAGARVNFIVNNRQAAALRIKHSAERIDASRLALYRAYMLKHYRSWARFIRELGFGFELRDMILVTGHDLTANWATATLIERASQGGITMQAGDSAILGASSSISGTTESSIRVPIRIGPNPYDPPRRSTYLSTEVSEASPAKDQCIFLRGFRVSEKLFVPRIMKAAAEPADLDSDGDSDAHSGVVSVGFDSDEDVHGEEEFVDHSFIMNAIHRAGAEIAIVHETDICKLAKMAANSTYGLNIESHFNDKGTVLDIEFDEWLQKKVGTIKHVPVKPEHDTEVPEALASHYPMVPEEMRKVYRKLNPHEAEDGSPFSVISDETHVPSTPFSDQTAKLDGEAFPDLDGMFSTSFSTSALEPSSIQPSPLIREVSTAVDSPRRNKVPTGTRKNVTPESLVPIEAPTQPRNYLMPSQTCRNAVPAVSERKRARSAAFGDDEKDEFAGSDRGSSISGTSALETPVGQQEAEAIASKRLQNTLAARRSRKRKLEYQRELEEKLETAHREREMWKERAMMLRARVMQLGFPDPFRET